MANRSLFGAAALPVTNTRNHAGASAYALSARAALAQIAMTGCFNDTFYASAGAQLADIQRLAAEVDSAYLARLAVYAREKGYMKDVPALLLSLLAARDTTMLSRVFARVVDNGRMLRNFVQMLRSGVAGRKSLGTRPKHLVAEWLNTASDAQLLAASVGTRPSLADVIRLAHPKAPDASRAAFYGWLMGRPVDAARLPALVCELEAFRQGSSLTLPRVPFELLTAMPLSRLEWRQIARHASWQQTRMNLNTFLRHGVFEDAALLQMVVDRLRRPELIARARVFPYQLLAACLNVSHNMPSKIVEALQDALERSVSNVPAFGVETEVLVDVSGSMSSPVTGYRRGATTAVRCIDVAGLFASVVLRRNPGATVTMFDTRVHAARLNPKDAIVRNAEKLASFYGGGTNCACALEALNRRAAMAPLVIYLSDNESWVRDRGLHGPSGVMRAWAEYRERVQGARLVCIDLVPNTTTQACEAHDILNVGGFSDDVFRVLGLFARDGLDGRAWIKEIEEIEL